MLLCVCVRERENAEERQSLTVQHAVTQIALKCHICTSASFSLTVVHMQRHRVRGSHDAFHLFFFLLWREVSTTFGALTYKRPSCLTSHFGIRCLCIFLSCSPISLQTSAYRKVRMLPWKRKRPTLSCLFASV